MIIGTILSMIGGIMMYIVKGADIVQLIKKVMA